MVQLAVAQPRRRRAGIKRMNTNLKILLEDDQGDAEVDDVVKDNRKDGNFSAHGKDYVYDKKSLFIYSSEWKIRKFIVWIIVWPIFDYFILL
jgi:hypothetical protein